MGPVHVPRQPGTRSRSARARRGHRRLTALAIAILAALTMMAGAQRAAFAATGATAATAATGAAAAADGPYGGTAAAVPGTVQAANYDTGGQGVGYNVSSANGSANSYRSDGVDLETTADTQDTSPAGGPYDLGWTTAGQWFKYTVNVATAGTYSVAFRVASPYGIADACTWPVPPARTCPARSRSPTRVATRPGPRSTRASPCRRPADADAEPGLQRLELPRHGVHPELGRGRPSGPVTSRSGEPGPGARHRPGGELRHRRARRRLQRHLRQRHRDGYRSDGVDLENTADTPDTSAAGGAYGVGSTTPGSSSTTP